MLEVKKYMLEVYNLHHRLAVVDSEVSTTNKWGWNQLTETDFTSYWLIFVLI